MRIGNLQLNDFNLKPTRFSGLRRIFVMMVASSYFILNNVSWAARIVSSQSGPWNIGSTWVGGVLPSTSDEVEITTSHVVVINGDVSCSTVTIYGEAKWESSTASGTLRVSNSNGGVIIYAGGALSMGTQTSPLANETTATLRLGSNNGITVYDGGIFRIWGSTRSPYSLATTNIVPGDTTFQVNSSSITNWAVGDYLAIGQTERSLTDQTKQVVITAINKSNGVIAVTPALSHYYYSTNTIVVANFFRNAIVYGTSGSIFIRNLNTSATNFYVNHGSLRSLGYSSSGKYGITFDGSSTAGIIEKSAIYSGHVGVYLNQSAISTITWNNFYDLNSGVSIFAASSNTIANNTIFSSTYGVLAFGATYNNVSSNRIISSTFGVTIALAANNTVSGNLTLANRLYGIGLFAAGANTINRNSSYLNYYQGLIVSTSPGNSFDGNSFLNNGSDGVIISSGNGNYFVNNTISGNLSQGLHEVLGDSNTFVSNIISSNVQNGVQIESSSSNTWTNNVVSNNGYSGFSMTVGVNNNIVSGQSVYSNGRYGFEMVNCSSNAWTSNLVFSNGYSGFDLTSCRGNAFVGNSIYSHSSGRGLVFSDDSDGIWLVGNSIYSNNDGLSLPNSDNIFVINNRIYDSSRWGLTVAGATVTLVDTWLGFDAAGASYPNAQGEISFSSRGSVVLKNSNVNSEVGVSTSSLSSEYRSILALNHNDAQGEVHLWGDYKVDASTFSLNYADPLFRSTATASLVRRRRLGSDPVFRIDSTTDSYCLNEVVVATYAASASTWTLTGSGSGYLGSFANAAFSNWPFPNSTQPKFYLTFTPGSSPSEGDRVDFLTLAASTDSSKQKKLYFHSSDATFNSGRSRLVIQPGAGFSMTGVGSAYNSMGMIQGGTYYTFLSSGSFAMSNSSVTNTDPDGIQLGKDAAVSMSSVTFDLMGIGNSSAYITARRLNSTASFNNIRFDLSRSTAATTASYNVATRDSATASPNWNFTNPQGVWAGESHNLDAIGTVNWSPTVPGNSSGTAVGQSSITWAWNDSDSETKYNVLSSTVGNMSGDLSADTTSWTEIGLSTNVAYSRRIGATSSVDSSSTSLMTVYSLAAPPTGFAVVSVNNSSAALQWGANTNPSYTSYRLAYWPQEGSTLTVTTAYSTAVVTGLSPDTTYYFQIYAVNGDSVTTAAASTAISTRTSVTFQSVQSGLWSSVATWSAGRLPGTSDVVIVSSGTTVTMNHDAVIAGLSIYGSIRWAAATASATLTMNGGDINVYAGGAIIMGTSGSALAAGTTATIILSSGSVSGQYGLIIHPGGSLTMQGATKSPGTTATADIAAGAVSLTVDTSSVTNWSNGDTIIVGQTNLSASNQTERRTIVAISTLTGSVTVDSALSYPHFSTSIIYVSNLTRNAIIRSSGTRTGYVRNLAVATTNFDITYAEFVALGTGDSGKYGLTFDGASTKGKIRFSVLRDGYTGIYLNGSSGSSLIANTMHANDFGLYLTQASSNVINGNHAVASSVNDGFYLVNSSSNTFIDNRSYSNADVGWYITDSHQNYFLRNRSFANISNGFHIDEAEKNTFESNASYLNQGYGLYLSDAGSATLLTNSIYENLSRGLSLSGSDSVFSAGNSFYSNSSRGIYIYDSADFYSVGDLSYANANQDLYVYHSTAILINGSLGYDQSGNSQPSATWEVYFTGAMGGELIMKNTKVNPSVGIATGTLTNDNRKIISYRQDQIPGQVDIWGSYDVESGTMTLNYASELYDSAATPPRVMRTYAGSNPVLTIHETSDTYCLSELIVATYTTSTNQWTFYGSSSGAMGSISNSLSYTQEYFPNSSAPKFKFSFTAGSSPKDGDRIDFVTVAAANDANVQKKLSFHPRASTFNSSRSRLTIKPGAGFQAIGTSSSPTIINMAEGGTYYTMVSSGAFSVQFSSFNNLDPDGLQITGSSATVSMSSTTFDYLGIAVSAGATSYYLTANNLSSNATFYSMTFAVSRSTSLASFAYNAGALGADSNLGWHFSQAQGAFSGESRDHDPNDKITWSLTLPGSLSGSALGISSISWSWTDVDGETGYRVESSTSGNMSGNLATDAVTWTETNLSTATAYSRKLTAYNSIDSVSSGLTTLYTLAAPPTGLAMVQVDVSSFVVRWGANTNPSDSVTYRLAYWPVNGSTTSVTSSVTTKTITGLTSGTTYFVQVYAVNANSVETLSQEAAVSTVTVPSPPTAPGSMAGSVLGTSSITWTWVDSEGESGYRVISSSNGDLSGALSAGATYWTETALSTNTAYSRRVEAYNNFGSSISLTTATLFTLAAPPSSLSLTAVYTTSVSIQWSFNSNPSTTSFRAYIWSTGSSTTTVASSNISTAAFSGLSAGTTYWLTVRALNGDNVLSEAATTITTTTTPAPVTTASIDPSSAATVVYNSPSGPVTIEIAAATFSEALTLTASLPLSFPADNCAAAVLDGTGVGVEITLDKAIQPLKNVALTITYTASDVSGRNENRLIVARYDTSKSVWVPLPSSVDAVSKTVSAQVDHFSLFQIMEVTPAAGVDSVVVFPNPWNKSRGHTSLTFSNLPASTSIKIYTLVGELVRELTTDNTGLASWDVKNDGGSDVASGVYFALAESPSGERKVFKVAVQR